MHDLGRGRVWTTAPGDAPGTLATLTVRLSGETQMREVFPMRVPLTVADFLDRAETAFAESVAVVDEPVQPAPPVPTTTYRELARRVRTWQAGLDGLGIGAGGADRDGRTVTSDLFWRFRWLRSSSAGCLVRGSALRSLRLSERRCSRCAPSSPRPDGVKTGLGARGSSDGEGKTAGRSGARSSTGAMFSSCGEMPGCRMGPLGCGTAPGSTARAVTPAASRRRSAARPARPPVPPARRCPRHPKPAAGSRGL